MHNNYMLGELINKFIFLQKNALFYVFFYSLLMGFPGELEKLTAFFPGTALLKAHD